MKGLGNSFRKGILLSAMALAGCASATRYDTGAVVLDVTDKRAYSAEPATSSTFMTAYDAIKAKDYTRAEALLAAALEERPKDPYAMLAMGSVMERTGRFYRASDYYQSAALYGENAPASKRFENGDEQMVESALTVADVARSNLAQLNR